MSDTPANDAIVTADETETILGNAQLAEAGQITAYSEELCASLSDVVDLARGVGAFLVGAGSGGGLDTTQVTTRIEAGANGDEQGAWVHVSAFLRVLPEPDDEPEEPAAFGHVAGEAERAAAGQGAGSYDPALGDSPGTTD